MNRVSEWLEHYQVPIAIGLVVFIAAGGIALLFEEQRNKLFLAANKPAVEQKAWEQERQEMAGRIGQLEKQIKALQEKNAAGQTVPTGQVAGASTLASQTGLVNINTADVAALDGLPGIGPAKAQAIISYRQQKGRFKSTAEIKNVSGIGESTFEKIKALITVQ